MTLSICTIALLILVLPGPSASQSTGFSIRPGLQTGLNFSDLDATSDPVTSKRTTFVGGVFIETKWWGKFSLQPEVQIVQKGARFDLPTEKTTIELGYLQFPLLAKFGLKPSGFIPYVVLGPNLGILLNAKSRTKASGTAPVSSDIQDRMRKIDFSIELGAGSEYRLADRVSFLIDIRVSLGLLDIDKTPDNRWETRDVKIITGTKFLLK